MDEPIQTGFDPFSVIKMITLIILISLFQIACKDKGGAPEASPAGVISSGGSVSESIGAAADEGEEVEDETDEEYLKRMSEETPHDAKMQTAPGDPAVLASGGPEVLSAFPPQIDADQDGFVDLPLANAPELQVDNCPAVANPDQADRDGDGIGDACE